jgi:glycosyltransferase involved in cell wall biosynthesis
LIDDSLISAPAARIPSNAGNGRPLRILHLIEGLALGGTQRQLALLMEEQVQRGHEVHVALITPGPVLPAVERSGARVHHLGIRTARDPRAIIRLLRLTRAIQPDVVQTWLTQMDVLGGLTARACGRAWVMTERSSRVAYTRTLPNWLRRQLGRFAHALVANSAAGVDYWTETRGGAPRYVVPNGIRLPEAELQRAAPGTRPLVLFAGRLVWEKNVGRLVDALLPLMEHAAVEALLCGEGPALPALLDRVRGSGHADRIQFEGYRSDLQDVMARAAVFVNPSLVEGQPNTVLEAIAAGCPVIVSDIPAHREILGPATAILCDPHDSSAWTKALADVLANPAAAAERARRARTLLTGRGVEEAAAEYDRIYADVLQSITGRD